jgi:two-component system, LytTR family, response regulator
MPHEALRRTTKALIIEDEPLVAKDLHNLLRQTDAGVEVLATLDSLAAAEQWFADSTAAPDVLFCDIQLSDGVSFELFKRVAITCPVIFTTAYDEYALRAFKLNSIDYLLKPIDRDELAAALGKLERWRNNYQTQTHEPEQIHPDQMHPAQVLQSQMQSLLQDIAQIQTQMQTPTQMHARRHKERFLVHAKGSMMLVETAQVACFQKDEVIYLVMADGKRFLTKQWRNSKKC